MALINTRTLYISETYWICIFSLLNHNASPKHLTLLSIVNVVLSIQKIVVYSHLKVKHNRSEIEKIGKKIL